MHLNVAIKNIKQGANINDIVVPVQLKKRCLTGIHWVDDALGGEGFVPSTVSMLTGMPGTGKSTLLRQLADSITAQGHIALYNSGEESLYQVKMTVERMGLTNGFVVGQEIMTHELLKYADVIRKTHPDKQLFLLQDSLQTLNDGKYANGTVTSGTVVRTCEMLTDYCKDNYTICIFVGQSTKDGDFAGRATIKHMVDCHATIFVDQDRRSETFGERLFEVSKNRYGVNGKTYIVGLEKNGLYEKGSFQKSYVGM